MNRFKITAIMLGLFVATLAPSVRADARSKETHVTISQPLQVENIFLAPGEYVFKVTNTDGDHRVVSIYNADGNRLEATVMGFSAYRPDAGKSLFAVSQAKGGRPVTLKSWFYWSDNFGVEFPVKSLTSEAGRAVSSNGRVVKSKQKGQTAGASDDGSSTRD